MLKQSASRFRKLDELARLAIVLQKRMGTAAPRRSRTRSPEPGCSRSPTQRRGDRPEPAPSRYRAALW